MFVYVILWVFCSFLFLAENPAGLAEYQRCVFDAIVGGRCGRQQRLGKPLGFAFVPIDVQSLADAQRSVDKRPTGRQSRSAKPRSSHSKSQCRPTWRHSAARTEFVQKYFRKCSQLALDRWIERLTISEE